MVTPSDGVYVPCIYSHARWVTLGDPGLCFVLRDVFQELLNFFVLLILQGSLKL